MLLNVEYYSFDSKLHRGQIVLHKNVEKDIKEIFEIIRIIKFPVSKVIPIAKYKWSDEDSMNDNNTSAFNYRKVKGQKILSAHSYGLAIDINPEQNPHIKRNIVQPANGKYDINSAGTILKNSRIVQEFKSEVGNGVEPGEAQKIINTLKRKISLLQETGILTFQELF